MSKQGPKRIPAGMTVLKVTVPIEVSNFYDQQVQKYGGNRSAVAAPVLCAYARGEIKLGFTQQPGGGDVGRP
jgi:hypothetical protein